MFFGLLFFFFSKWRISGRIGVLLRLCLIDQKRIMRSKIVMIRQVEQAVGYLGQAYFGEICNLVRHEHKKMLSKSIMHPCDG